MHKAHHKYHRICTPVSPHIKKYMEARYGDPIILKQLEPAHFVFYQMLERPAPGYKEPEHDCTITFLIPLQLKHEKKDLRSEGLMITELNARRYNRFLDRTFRADAYRYLSGCIIAGMEIRKSILHFLGKFDISEEDFSLDALKKAFYRWRKTPKSLIINT